MPDDIPTAAFLTIDSNLGEETESILDVLEDYDIDVTFFVSIDDLYAADDLLRRIAGSGHSIGLLLTQDQAEDWSQALELLDEANDKLSVITGTPTRLVRISGGSAGALSTDGLEALQDSGYRVWDWDEKANETSLSTDSAYNALIEALDQTGTVTVRFGENEDTADVLEQLLPYIQYCGIPAKSLSAGDTPVCQIS